MSTLILHPCMAKFFSNLMHQETMRHISKCSEETRFILAPAWIFLIYYYNLQPPQDLIMELLLFFTAIISTLLSFMQLYAYLIQNKQTHKLKRNKYKKKTCLTITTAFNSEASIKNLTHRHKLNIISITFVVANVANVHIVNDKSLFKEIIPCSDRCVATIGGSDLEAEGIFTVITQITDDNGTTSNIILENALYFPSSPVNIISITCLGDFLKDNYDTFIKTTRYASEFT